jgi:hypothetical protein
MIGEIKFGHLKQKDGDLYATSHLFKKYNVLSDSIDGNG